MKRNGNRRKLIQKFCLAKKNALNEQGYYLSLEAIASLALLGSLLAMPLHNSSLDLNELHVFKKENDLLLHWAKTNASLDAKTIEQEFKFAFPGKSGKILWNGKKISIGKPGEESVGSKAVFFGKGMQKQEITLIVFKQDFS